MRDQGAEIGAVTGWDVVWGAGVENPIEKRGKCKSRFARYKTVLTGKVFLKGKVKKAVVETHSGNFKSIILLPGLL